MQKSVSQEEIASDNGKVEEFTESEATEVYVVSEDYK